MSLISPFEVIKYSGAGPSYPVDNIRLLIPIYERDFLIGCIGDTYYNLLLKDVRKFETATVYVKNQSYTAGDYVIYNGAILESCISLNTTEPSVINDKWKEPSKFTKKAYNGLWDNYLRNILAFVIYKEAIPYDTIKSGAKGLIVSESDQSGATTADSRTIEYVLRHKQKHIDLLISGLKKYITDQYELFKADSSKGADYSEVSFIKDSCENCNGGVQNRRIGFIK